MYRAITIAILLVSSLQFAPAVAADGPETASCLDYQSRSESDVADIRARVTMSMNVSDAVRITYNTRNLNGGFSVDLPTDVKLVAMAGFEYDESEDRYRYTGGEKPYLVYRIDVEGEARQYASGERWIFAPTPSHNDVGVNLHPHPTGVIGDQFLYLGNHSSYGTTAGCHDIQLVVASSGDLGSQPSVILETLRYAAIEHDVGHRYDQVTIFATPGEAQPPVEGFANGNEAWVTTSLGDGYTGTHARLFVHEYIHTRQAFGGFQLSSMSWFNEGLAEYYSYKYTLESGLIKPEQYNRWLKTGSEMPGVLTNPGNLSSRNVAYYRGGVFLAVLDAKIQAASNASLEDVVRIINARGSPGVSVAVQQSLVLAVVGNLSNPETTLWANETLASYDGFDAGIARIEERSSQQKLIARIKRMIREQPLLAVVDGFLIGTLITALVYRLKGHSRDDTD